MELLDLSLRRKSLLRFKETDTAKTEYVLAGTLLSFGISDALRIRRKVCYPVVLIIL